MSLLEKQPVILDKCVDALKIWQTLVEESLEGDEKANEIEILKELTKDYCIIDNEFQRSKAAIEKVDQYFDNKEETAENSDVAALYQNHLNSIAHNNYLEHDVWSTIFRDHGDVQEVTRREVAIDDSKFEQINKSVSCSSVFKPPIDPISKTVIRDPYRNRKCKHVYENEFIHNYIRKMKNKAKCPYIGCGISKLNASDLVEDVQLKGKIQEYVDSHNSEEESD